MQNNTETKVWNATLYLRLSRDDGDKEESNSITGQRELLRDFMVQFREQLNITELERRIVVALIDRILIYKDNRVEARFRFADKFAWQTDILRRSQIKEVV